MFNVKTPLITLLATSVIMSCSETQDAQQDATTQESNAQEIKGIPYTTYTIDAAHGASFYHTGGSEIIIPKNAFVDGKGNTVTGKVKIKYREFHDAADIIASDIPMQFGPDLHLETAGMFDIRAYQNGKEITARQGQSIHINMVSYVDDGCYNQFYLDDAKRQWQVTGNDYPKTDTEIEDLTTELKSIKTGIKVPLGPRHFIMGYENADVFLGPKARIKTPKLLFSELKKFNVSWVNIRTYETLEFYGKKYPACMLVWKRRSGQLPDWPRYRSKVKIKKKQGNVYKLYLYNAKTKEKRIVEAEAVMTMKYLFGKPARNWIDEYEKAIAEKARIEKELKAAEERRKNRYNRDVKVFRAFEVVNFGIYNCDRFKPSDGATPIIASYDFGDKAHAGDAVEFRYVSGSNRSVITYYGAKNAVNLKLVPDNNAMLFAILNDNTIMYWPKEEMSNLNLEQLKKQGKNARVNINFKEYKEKFTNAETLKELLGTELDG